ncbi:MAG: hypothetical protein ACYC0V_13005 [Armatimonadota bacterium]
MKTFLHQLVLMFCILVLASCYAICGPQKANSGWDAAWSPDGTMIAFASGTPHGIPNLWTVKSDGTGFRQLTNRGANAPSWTPDGKSIIFGTVRSGNASYMSISPKGVSGSEKPLSFLPKKADDPVWSRDGSLVAFGLAGDDGSRDLWFTRASGGAAAKLSGKFWVREWAWSPDNTALAFVVGKATGTSLWLVDPGTKQMKMLYQGYCRAPVYSPDGKQIVISVPDVRSGFKIQVIDILARKDRAVAVTTFDGQRIMWSPDGSRMYFASGGRFEPSIWSVKADGSDLLRVTAAGLPAQNPSLSPDGKKLVFQCISKDAFNPEPYICDTSGASLKRLVQSAASTWSPVWSPDGKKIAFLTDVHHSIDVLIASSSGRDGKPVASVLSPEPGGIRWFPDSKRLIASDAGSLEIIDPSLKKDVMKPFINTTEPLQLPRFGMNDIYYVEWHGRNSSICAIKQNGTGARILTNKPVLPVKSPPIMNPHAPVLKPTPGVKPAPIEKPAPTSTTQTSAGILVASVDFFAPQPETTQKPLEKRSILVAEETGNPHQGLGVIGPHPDVGKLNPEPVAIVDLMPAASPDGKMVAFIRGGQIWLIGADGKGQRKLTKISTVSGSNRMLLSPSWSPKSDKIMFQSLTNESGGMKSEIRLVDVRSASSKMIYSEDADSEYAVYYNECTNPAALAPDGSRIIFTSLSTGNPRIVSIGLDGKGLRELVPAPSSFPSLDKTGTKLAYVDLRNSLEKVQVLNLKH